MGDGLEEVFELLTLATNLKETPQSRIEAATKVRGVRLPGAIVVDFVHSVHDSNMHAYMHTHYHSLHLRVFTLFGTVPAIILSPTDCSTMKLST